MLRPTLDLFRALRGASAMKVSRRFEGFFADRIVQSASQPTLLACVEHLARSMDCSLEYVGGKRIAAFTAGASGPEAEAVLVWLRAYPRVASMVCMLRDDDDYAQAVETIAVQAVETDQSTVGGDLSWDIPITAQLLAPLAHGADAKAGNATLFRRRQAITSTGRLLSLPYYAGNALRGQLRDLLADHFLDALGLPTDRARPCLALWFFHVLYAGGVLEEGGRATKALDTALGQHGAVRSEGVRELRNQLPALSLLGTAVGNRILAGRVHVGDLRPACLEWGTGTVPVAQLMGWEYLTRRDDYEGRTEDDDHAGMIASTEVLAEGVILHGGVDIAGHIAPLERAALGRGLYLLQRAGMLGAENRRGLGKVRLVYEAIPDPAPYDAHLVEHAGAIREYLSAIGALVDARDAADCPDVD